jgi:hypothetical protein
MTNADLVTEPQTGQRFLDEQGVYWLVQAVTRSDQLNGFYIVRMAFGDDERCEKGVWVLGRREYEALWRERNLKPVQPIQ